jgi:hypothetical protein
MISIFAQKKYTGDVRDVSMACIHQGRLASNASLLHNVVSPGLLNWF